jgi:hypothetical protein
MMSMHSSTHSSQMKTVGAGNQLAHLVLALAAERAIQRVLALAAAASADLAHVKPRSVRSAGPG